MNFEARRLQLDAIFKGIDENQKILIDRLLDEIAFLEVRMTELKKLPFIAVHPQNNSLQKTTAAARQYKECSQSYMNGIRILVSVLNKADEDAQNELLKRLEEFA